MLYSILAINTIAKEVDKQQAGPLAVTGLAKAVQYGHSIIDKPLTVEHVLAIGNYVDSSLGVIRSTPVVFRGGGGSLHHSLVPRQLELWAKKYNEIDVDIADYIYIEQHIRSFLWIHPFKDGNGRTAFVLYNMLHPYGMKMFVINGNCLSLRSLPNFDWS